MPDPSPDQPPNIRDEQLDRAYRNARYVANGFTLRIDVPHPDFDRWLTDGGYHAFTILTAQNPHSTPLSPQANADRHRQLLAEPLLREYPFVDAAGSDPEGGWPEEIGVCLLDVPAEAGRALARKYRQHAIVEGRRGGRPRLVWL